MPGDSKPLFALLAAQETSPSVLYGLYDVLYSVGAVFSDMTVGQPGSEAVDVRIVAAGAEPFRCIGNVLVEPHASLAQIDKPDDDGRPAGLRGRGCPDRGGSGRALPMHWSAPSARDPSFWPKQACSTGAILRRTGPIAICLSAITRRSG